MVVRLISSQDKLQARQLVEANGFRFEERYDALFGIFEGSELIATAARDQNIFKMICIRDSHQGGGLLGELFTALLDSCPLDGAQNVFVYTRPERRFSFQQLNFQPLVNHSRLCLLEYGNGLQHYLEQHADLRRSGCHGAVVVNCNPFTNGHLYLIEQAASQVDHLFVFVVREDRSLFPFRVRYRLVEEGTRHLDNVSVIDTADYAVSQVTFPGYFLKQEEDQQLLQMEIDLLLFARHIAPYFGITRRFIGSEPYCRTTRLYSDAMHRILRQQGIGTLQFERCEQSGEPISAFRVREALRREAFESLSTLVPETTLNYLRSTEARGLLTTMKTYQRRH